MVIWDLIFFLIFYQIMSKINVYLCVLPPFHWGWDTVIQNKLPGFDTLSFNLNFHCFCFTTFLAVLKLFQPIVMQRALRLSLLCVCSSTEW